MSHPQHVINFALDCLSSLEPWFMVPVMTNSLVQRASRFSDAAKQYPEYFFAMLFMQWVHSHKLTLWVPVTYLRSSPVQVTAWRLLYAKPLPGGTLAYCQLPTEQLISGWFQSKSNNFHSGKCTENSICQMAAILFRPHRAKTVLSAPSCFICTNALGFVQFFPSVYKTIVCQAPLLPKHSAGEVIRNHRHAAAKSKYTLNVIFYYSQTNYNCVKYRYLFNHHPILAAHFNMNEVCQEITPPHSFQIRYGNCCNQDGI